MSIHSSISSQSRQNGFTLIEVLIAALVLSVGLLGLAGLQAIAQKLGHSAYQRSQAASLAYEIADAIRANARNASQYEGSATTNADDCDSNLSRIDTDTVANNDLSEWVNRIACLFPGGAEYAIMPSASSVDIGIYWDTSESRVRALAPGEDAPEDPEDDSGEDLRDEFEVTIPL